jgi:UDP-N-acetylmuramoyl-tripeptide--D-alanyl-D-alanine ligase
MTLADAAYACGGELYISSCLQDINGDNCDYVPHDESIADKDGNKSGDGRLYEIGSDVYLDTEFLGGVTDSRRIQPGCLFFAVGGQRVDGHSFVASAYQKGAVCCVVSKTPEEVETTYGIFQESWGAYILVGDVLQALKDIAEAYRRTLSIPVIGVTGSVGKTSTKEWIASVLEEKYSVLKTEGNFNNEIGLPLTLLRIRREHQVAVVEMGISDFGEMTRLSKIARPDMCVITNIGQCHLENLKDRDGVLQAKSEIFTYMNPEGWVCLNGEDDKLRTVTQVHGKKPLFFGIEAERAEAEYTHEAAMAESRHTSVMKGMPTALQMVAESIVEPSPISGVEELPVRAYEINEDVYVEKAVYLTDIKSKGLLGSSASLHIRTDTGEETAAVELPLPGEHMVLNAAAAACVAHLLGLTLEQIRSGIEKAQSVSGRSHLLSLTNYMVIDDCYNANPVSMKAALDLLMLADTPKAAVLGDMFELGENTKILHRDVGEFAAKLKIQRLFFIGEQAKEMYIGAKMHLGNDEAALKQTDGGYDTTNDRCADISEADADQKDKGYETASYQIDEECETVPYQNSKKCETASYQIDEECETVPYQNSRECETASYQNEKGYETASYHNGTRVAAWYRTKEVFLDRWHNADKTACHGYTILLKASHGMGFSELMKSMFSDSENKSLQ